MIPYGKTTTIAQLGAIIRFHRKAAEHATTHGSSAAIALVRRVIRKQCRRTLELLR
jgi:hypothetical protein